MSTTSSNQDNAGVPVPRYCLQRYAKLREKLLNKALGPFYGVTPYGKDFDRLVQALTAALPKVTFRTIYDSVRSLAGVTLTVEVINNLAWRLSANIERLQMELAVPEWSQQAWPEWVPVHVLSCEAYRTQQRRHGGLFRLRVLAGTPCPRIIRTFWSNEFCAMLARRLGYTAKWGKYPFRRREELVSMRMLVLVDPKYCQAEQLGFKNVLVSSALLKWNRGIIRQRFRVGWECPYAYLHPCFDCHVGYVDCPAATHRETVLPRGPIDAILETKRADAAAAAAHVQSPS